MGLACHCRGRAEAANVTALQEAGRQQAAQLQVHHSAASAAAAAVAAARRDEAAARDTLAAARNAERAFLTPAAPGSPAAAEPVEPHCELCGQALRGAAAEVTQANLRAAVGAAEGQRTSAASALKMAQASHADAARKQQKLEATLQV